MKCGLARPTLDASDDDSDGGMDFRCLLKAKKFSKWVVDEDGEESEGSDNERDGENGGGELEDLIDLQGSSGIFK